MIGYMQKHKKYFVVVIWISTIAFVGAGFVGWGAYSFSNVGGSVAEVGKVEITQAELQNEYSRIYNMYNQALGGQMDEEKAKTFKLEESALGALINSALYENLAIELGLSVDEGEIAQKVVEIKAFYKDGNFDKPTYIEALSRSGLSITEFEESIRKEIIAQKLRDALNLPISRPLADTFYSIFKLQDDIKLKILKASDFASKHTEEEIKAFWEGNKKRYMSERVYEGYLSSAKFKDFNSSENELKELYKAKESTLKDSKGEHMSFGVAKNFLSQELADGKAKKSALKTYIELKKDNGAGQKISIKESDSGYSEEFMESIRKLKPQETIKPIKNGEEYVIFKLESVLEPTEKPYESAKVDAAKDLSTEASINKMKEAAEKQKESFDGVQTGLISRSEPEKLTELPLEDATQFLNTLFESKNKNGVIYLGDKGVIYEILEQRLLENNESTEEFKLLESNLLKLKEQMQEAWLTESLKKRYEVRINR